MGRKSKAQLAHQEWLRQLGKQAEEGNVEAIFQDLLDHQGESWDRPHRLKALGRAVKAAAEKGSEALIEVMFSRMLTTCLTLQLQREYILHESQGSWYQGNSRIDLEPARNDLIPALDQLYRRGSEIAKIYGTLKHSLNLADRPAEQDIRVRVLRIVHEAGATDEPGQQPETKVG